MTLATMVEADAGCGPLIATLFENDLSHRSVCQDTQVGTMRNGQVVRGRGIRACGSLRVDSYYIRPYTNVQAKQMRFVRLEAQLVEGFVPVRVRLRILWQIGNIERTASAHDIATVVDLMLLLLCRIRRLDEVLAFLVEWAFRVSGQLRLFDCRSFLTAGHPSPILRYQASPRHPDPPGSAGSRS